jgi:hypothetical protein
MKYYKKMQPLQSDLWIICDGPVHQSGKKQIYFGVRGDTNLDLTVYASKDPYTVDIMETGHKSCNDASAIISFNEDDDGRVTIKDFMMM